MSERMTEGEAADLLHRLAGDVREVPPPVDRLIAGGRVMRRRRRMRHAAGAVVATIAVVSAGAFVLDDDEGTGRDPAYVDRDAQPAPPPTAAPGTRLVGLGSVVVEVPQEWVVAENGCARDTGVVFRYPDTPEEVAVLTSDCRPFPHDKPSASLTLGDTTSPTGVQTVQASAASRTLDIGGLSVTQTSWHHKAPDFCSPGGGAGEACELLFWAPAEDTYFHLFVRGPGARETVLAVRDSIQVLPEGYTTVPFIKQWTEDADAARTVEEAGLEARLPSVDWPHSVMATDPPAGSVIEVGGTVQLIPGDG